MYGLMVIALVAASAAGGDTPVSVEVSLDPPVIPFHRQARYTIAVEADAGAEIEFSEMVEKFGGLNVADVERGWENLKGGRCRATETYVLDPIVAATYPIAPAEIGLGDGTTITVPSPALRVRPLTAEEEAAAEQFAPNAGPLSLPKPMWLTWPFWAVAGVVVVGVGLGLWWLKTRPRRTRGRMAPPALPWEVAYARLRQLDERNLPEAGKYEPYYVDLSSILRYYIEDRFLLHAPEQTTPEFLDAAARSGELNEVHCRLLASFLRHCDRVKFAQYEPSLEEMERGFDVVLRFVDETKPKPDEGAEEVAA